MANRDGLLRITDLRGGENSTDSPHAIPDQQVVEAKNVEYDRAMLARRRLGSKSLTSLWGLSTNKACTWLHRHLPSADESAAELWMTDNSSTVVMGRLTPAGPTAFSSVTVTDTFQSTSRYETMAASLNGKLFIAYNASVDRLHVWDGTSLRRVGLAAPSSAPTTATSAGAVTDTRKYRSRLEKRTGSTVDLRSETSADTAAVPLVAQKCTLTLAGAPSESETHWVLEAASSSSGYVYWYIVGSAAIGNTIEDNNASLDALDVAPEDGLYTTPGSVRHVIADENRLIMAGYFWSSAYQSRVWWTPVLGSADVGDDERIVNQTSLRSYLDLDTGDGGRISGLASLQGVIYVFKFGQIYKLIRTGNAATPYLPQTVSKTIGAVNPRAIVEGEDEQGEPCLYFWSRQGPYRLSQRGLEWMGYDLKAYIARATLTTNAPAHAIYHAAKRQVWFTVCLDGETVASHRFVFHVEHGRSTASGVRGGWVEHTHGSIATASCMFSRTLDSAMSLDLAPYIGLNTGFLMRADEPGENGDNGTALTPGTTYTASFKTKAYDFGSFDTNAAVTGLSLVARTASGEAPALTVSIHGDFDEETVTEDVTVINGASTTASADIIEIKKDLSQHTVYSFEVEDTAGSEDQHWAIDALVVRFRGEERR